CPVGNELLNRGQLHALRAIFDELFGGQARRLDSAAQVFERLFRNVQLEWTDLGCGFDGCHAHLPVVGSTYKSLRAVALRRRAANSSRAVALRRRGERSNNDTLRTPTTGQRCSPDPYKSGWRARTPRA